jgi:hypothetical protein
MGAMTLEKHIQLIAYEIFEICFVAWKQQRFQGVPGGLAGDSKNTSRHGRIYIFPTMYDHVF